MFIISFIFQLADHIVEFVGGGFLWLVYGLMSIVSKGFSAFWGLFSPDSATYGGIWLLLFILLIMCVVGALYFAPWLLLIIFVAIPFTLILLKYMLGWLMLLGLVRLAYRLGKRTIQKLHYQLTKMKVERGEKHES